jgi:hypothetical protein
MSSNDQNRSRKILVPLATMAVAAAVVVGSGATWTSESQSSVMVTSGNIKHNNSANGMTLTALNLKPGDSQTGTLKISNTGSLPAQLKISQAATPAPTNTFSSTTAGVSDLHLKIEKTGETLPVYNGDFGEFDSKSWGSDTLAALAAANTGDSDDATFTFTVSLDPNADKSSQGQSATASFDFVTTQLQGQSFTGLFH